ncbi:MAG: GAF domain-containing protein [Bacteroidales bacterium]|nr:GAF domain-containing protein [Bacteroidales bacterium]
MKTPEKISIKVKFRIMLACFAMYVVATGLSALYLIHTYDTLEESFQKETKLKNDISDLRNAQYELFNLYSSKKDKEKEDVIKANIEEVCRNIDAGIAFLTNNPIDDSRQLKQSITILQDEFSLYKQKNAEIQTVEDEITELTQDGGRLATSRNSVKNTILQTAVVGIYNMYVEASKHEARFLEKSNIDDYTKFNKQIDGVNSILKNVGNASMVIKYQIYKLEDQFAEYRMTFNLLFSKQLLLGLDNYEGYKGEANAQVRTMLTNMEELMLESNLLRQQIRKTVIHRVLWLQVVLLAIGIPFFLVLFWSINKPIKNMNDYLSRLLKGELVPAEVSPDSNNEMDLMCIQLSEFIGNLKQKQQFTEDIGNHKQTDGFTLLSNNDELGNALINMKKNLDEQTEKQLARRREDEIQDKINIGLADFGNILRRNNNDIDNLCNETIRALIHYMGADYGAIYIYVDEEPDDIHLEMKATYAADRKKFLVKKISLYEGIVGTCAVEKTMQVIDEIPKDYIKIGSGFGNTKPSSLIVAPLLLNEDIYGVIEICRTDKFEEYRIKFLERLTEDIASTISYVKENTRNLFKLHEKGKRLEDYTKRLHKAKNDLAEKDAEIQKCKAEITKLSKENAALNEERNGTSRKRI